MNLQTYLLVLKKDTVLKKKNKSSKKTKTKLASFKRNTTLVTPTPESVHLHPLSLTDIVCLMACTNNVGNGERLKHVILCIGSTQEIPYCSSGCDMTISQTIQTSPE